MRSRSTIPATSHTLRATLPFSHYSHFSSDGKTLSRASTGMIFTSHDGSVSSTASASLIDPMNMTWTTYNKIEEGAIAAPDSALVCIHQGQEISGRLGIGRPGLTLTRKFYLSRADPVFAPASIRGS